MDNAVLPTADALNDVILLPDTFDLSSDLFLSLTEQAVSASTSTVLPPSTAVSVAQSAPLVDTELFALASLIRDFRSATLSPSIPPC